MADILTMARQYPDLSVTIRLGDLLEANERLVRRVREDVEAEAARRRVEYGDPLIPKAEARRILGNVDPSTLWRWEKAGYLTPVKIGVKVFYRKGQLDALIQQHEIKDNPHANH